MFSPKNNFRDYLKYRTHGSCDLTRAQKVLSFPNITHIQHLILYQELNFILSPLIKKCPPHNVILCNSNTAGMDNIELQHVVRLPFLCLTKEIYSVKCFDIDEGQ